MKMMCLSTILWYVRALLLETFYTFILILYLDVSQPHLNRTGAF